MEQWVVPVCTVVVTLIVPFLVNLVKNNSWSANAKRWIAIIVSVIAGVATGCMAGMPTPETLVTWCLSVMGGVQVAYALFKSIGVTSNWLDSLEGIGSKKSAVVTIDEVKAESDAK